MCRVGNFRKLKDELRYQRKTFCKPSAAGDVYLRVGFFWQTPQDIVFEKVRMCLWIV
jgi:hypothetical protein